VFGAVDAVAAGDARAALVASARLAESGRDLGRFFTDLEAHARALMVVQALGEVPAELRITPEQDERLAAQAKAVAPADVIRLLDMIAAALRALKDGADARTQLELALVKAAEPAHDPTVKALLARIERLEARAGGSPPPAPAAKAPSEPATAAGRTRVAVSAQVSGQPPVAASTTVPGTPEGGAPEAQAAAEETASSVAKELATEADPAPAVTAVAVVEPDAEARAPSFELSHHGIEEIWPAVLETLAADSPRTAELLRQATPMAVEEGLTLAWPESAAFYKRQAEGPEKRELIAQSIRAVTGASLRLAFELRADDEIPAPAEAPLSDDELVARFKSEFDAEELPPPTEEK
jgi:DNA polymerase-3 subunit gamma/tau